VARVDARCGRAGVDRCTYIQEGGVPRTGCGPARGRARAPARAGMRLTRSPIAKRCGLGFSATLSPVLPGGLSARRGAPSRTRWTRLVPPPY